MIVNIIHELNLVNLYRLSLLLPIFSIFFISISSPNNFLALEDFTSSNNSKSLDLYSFPYFINSIILPYCSCVLVDTFIATFYHFCFYNTSRFYYNMNNRKITDNHINYLPFPSAKG